MQNYILENNEEADAVVKKDGKIAIQSQREGEE
jgi:hypothetical protein